MKTYDLLSINSELGRNIRACGCVVDGCNAHLEKGEGYRVMIPSKGIRVVCAEHYSNECLLGYHGNANIRSRSESVVLGTPKKTSLAQTTIGVELEVYSRDIDLLNSVRAYFENIFSVKAESDCTVSAEFPTEKMRGLAKMSKVLQSMEMHNLLSILNNEHCGAHIHCGCNDVDYIRRYYHSIFCPLSDYVVSIGNAKTVELFGRGFNDTDWAKPINRNSDVYEHRNIFNMQHNHTIELRLPRVSSYKQYMHILKWWRGVVHIINNYDLHKNAPQNEERLRYARALGEALVTYTKNNL